MRLSPISGEPAADNFCFLFFTIFFPILRYNIKDNFLTERNLSMKRFLLIFISALLFLTGTAFAAKPEIHYDHQEFNPDTMSYVLTGNVSVAVNNRTITADKAVVSFLTNEVRAAGHIKLVQDDITFTGKEAYVSGASHSADITGPLRFTQGNTVITAKQGTFDWETKEAKFIGDVVYKKDKETLKQDSLTYNVKTGQIKK
jgi:lipopolysaccharide assembly outer membrane protein LptD (OstA)